MTDPETLLGHAGFLATVARNLARMTHREERRRRQRSPPASLPPRRRRAVKSRVQRTDGDVPGASANKTTGGDAPATGVVLQGTLEYVVTLSAKGHQAVEHRIRVVAGETTQIEATLPKR